MKLNSLFLGILTLSLLPICAFADEAKAPAIGEALAPVPGPLTAVGDTTKPDSPNTAVYEFKAISAAQTEPVTHDFALRNTGDLQLNIGEARVSCECMNVTIDGEKQGEFKPINPGQEVKVRVSIDPRSLYAGKVNKVVWLIPYGMKTPIFTLQMNGEITAPLVFEPQLLDFGDVALNDVQRGPTRRISITTDTAVYGKKPPEPVSLKKLVKIKRDTMPVQVSGSMITRSYDVTLTNRVELGLLDDMISLPFKEANGRPNLTLAVTGDIVAQLPKTVLGAQDAARLPRAEADRLASIGLPMPTMSVGQSAPNFSVTDANGKRWNLRNLRGARNVLLTFFPKCFTGGCANHLSSLRDHQSEIALSQTQIIAVSVDPAEGEKGQKAFAKLWSFDFPLIPDTSRALSKLYGAVQNDDERSARMSFLIDKQGIVRYIDTNVAVRTHGTDMVDKIRELGLK